jgi:lysyl-tRNA synthetase class 2
MYETQTTIQNTIETVMVNSSAIYSAEYDLAKQTLKVYFNNESIYDYLDVPEFYWRGLVTAPSKGKFLNSYVFKSFYFKRID